MSSTRRYLTRSAIKRKSPETIQPLISFPEVKAVSKKAEPRLKTRPIQKANKSLTKFVDLNEDVLEAIVSYLDTSAALNLLVVCKSVHCKLKHCTGFWYQLCLKEKFDEYSAIKQDSTVENEHEEQEPSKKRRSVGWVVEKPNKPEIRKAYNGEDLHKVTIPPEATYWRRVFLRGLQMRRNVCAGRFEMWRLFLTDKDHLPVKKMTKDTSFRELRSCHRSCDYNTKDRHVRINRYWTEEYMVAIQFRWEKKINDVFVWEWDECQSPRFKYVYDLYEMYPEGLCAMAFFLWKNYMVFMPNAGCHRKSSLLRAMIRVHDLSDNMKLVGSYDLPEISGKSRLYHALNIEHSHEASHLHKMGKYAVALARVPNFHVFVFSLPDCQLVREIRLSFPHVERPLEKDDLEQRYLAKKNAMYFLFNDSDVLMNINLNANEEPKILSRMVMLDFDDFLKPNADLKEANIHARLDEEFDIGNDYMEKISLIGKRSMASIQRSGNVVFKDVIVTSEKTCTTRVRKVIPVPEKLRDEHAFNFDEVEEPTLIVARAGKQILVWQHFVTGRKIRAYDTRYGNHLFTINVDKSTDFLVTPKANLLSIDMDGDFVCAADFDKVLIWSSKDGRFLRSIEIPKHYRINEDAESQDFYSWRGHTDFAFAEDGLVIVHAQRNFPIAADILLFW